MYLARFYKLRKNGIMRVWRFTDNDKGGHAGQQVSNLSANQ